MKTLERCYLLKMWHITVGNWIYFHKVLGLFKKALSKKLSFKFSKNSLYKSEDEAIWEEDFFWLPNLLPFQLQFKNADFIRFQIACKEMVFWKCTILKAKLVILKVKSRFCQTLNCVCKKSHFQIVIFKSQSKQIDHKFVH